MQNVLKTTFVILGAIIGAGFISGQEIYIFFNRFGNYGIIGIIISGIIMGITIQKSCNIIKKENIQNYQEFVEKTICIKNKYIKLIMNNIVTIFLLISFFIMCAGFNNYFKQEFQIPIYIIGTINCIICYIIFTKNNKMVSKINEILIPIILFLILFLIIKINPEIKINEINFNKILFNAIISGIIYSTYNTILLIPILITLNKYIENKKQILTISIICSIIIIILSIIIFLLINTIQHIEDIEIPLIYIANIFGKKYYYIYSIVIVSAIFTTLISVGYGFLKNVTQKRKNYDKLAIIIGISSIFISYIGFSNLVELLYPIFGILGIIQIIFVLRY